MNFKTLYLIRGLPGSGKSTFARALLQSGLVSDFVEADQYFVGEKLEFNPALLPTAHAWCQKVAEMTLQKGLSIAVCNTSTTEKEVLVYEQMAKDNRANFCSMIMENRHGSSSIHDVPPATIERMRRRFSLSL